MPLNVAGMVFVAAAAIALPEISGESRGATDTVWAVSTALAPLAGMAFILAVIRETNRRDDPRSSLPRDPP